MTNEELIQFKNMFSMYCRDQRSRGNCTGDTCEWCPIQQAYEDIERFEREDNSIWVRIYNIEWDTDGEEIDLPKEVVHKFEGYSDIYDNELDNEIQDWLSDEYGFCHSGYTIEKIKDAKTGE